MLCFLFCSVLENLDEFTEERFGLRVFWELNFRYFSVKSVPLCELLCKKLWVFFIFSVFVVNHRSLILFVLLEKV